MNDDKLQEALGRAIRMKEWANGPDGLFAVFDAVEKNYFDTFKQSPIDDPAIREAIYHRINALKDLRRAMELVIAKGAEAQAIIDKLSKMQARKGQKTRAPVNVA